MLVVVSIKVDHIQEGMKDSRPGKGTCSELLHEEQCTMTYCPLLYLLLPPALSAAVH